MFDLTEGVFVTGNVLLGNGSGGYVPNFSVRVSGNRAALWKQAVLTKANGRLCTIHETQADLDAHIQRLARTFAETNHTNN
jgi:hypothetical protein